jgi:hypothetical protein
MPDPFLILLSQDGNDPFMSALIRKKFEDSIFHTTKWDESDFLPVVVDGSGWVIGRHGYTGMGDFIHTGTHGNTGMGFF